MLADFDKRLSLMEQSSTLYAKASDARWESVQRSVDGLTSAVNTALTTLSTISADPSASPAGRQLLQMIHEIDGAQEAQDKEVEEHNRFISETRGALRLAKFALGTAVIGVIGDFLLAIADHAPRPG